MATVSLPKNHTRTISVTVEVELDVREYGSNWEWWGGATVGRIAQDAEWLLARMVAKSMKRRMKAGWLVPGFTKIQVYPNGN